MAKSSRAEIGEDHLHLAAIVAVDRARRVEAGDAVLERQAGARPDLYLIAGRDRHREAGGDRGARAGGQHHVLGRDYVHARRARGGIGGSGRSSPCGRRLRAIRIGASIRTFLEGAV